MRTAILLAAIIIAHAINPDMLFPWSIKIIASIFIVFDISEFIVRLIRD